MQGSGHPSLSFSKRMDFRAESKPFICHSWYSYTHRADLWSSSAWPVLHPGEVRARTGQLQRTECDKTTLLPAWPSCSSLALLL